MKLKFVVTKKGTLTFKDKSVKSFYKELAELNNNKEDIIKKTSEKEELTKEEEKILVDIIADTLNGMSPKYFEEYCGKKVNNDYELKIKTCDLID